MTVIKITDHIYVGTEYLASNVGVIVTEQGLVLIDTPAIPGEICDLTNELNQISPLNITYLIYTHEHFDHLIGGNHFMGQIVAHQSSIDEIKYLKTNLSAEVNRYFPDIYRQYKEAFDSTEIALPQITFEGKLELHMENLTIKLFHAGGHSKGSLAVHVPEDKVLFAGDNIVSGMPLVTPNSRFNEWIEFLHCVETMEVDKIIPGHGIICDEEAVTKTRLYFEALRCRVKSFIYMGANRKEVMEKIEVADILSVPTNELITQQIRSTIGVMYDEMMSEMEDN
ncbi:MAG: MBL fold metallo-hydrolase [Thermoplasmata archaeon]|nr:MAG: MBL fold metallo-hydrolase [Thermoplasmata archaeon]